MAAVRRRRMGGLCCCAFGVSWVGKEICILVVLKMCQKERLLHVWGVNKIACCLCGP